MGTWGIDIFQDDLAVDVRDEYLEIIRTGLSTNEATKTIIERFQDELGDPEEFNVFWISLAATQVEHQLSTLVKEKALDIIQSGDDLERWMADPRLYNERQNILKQLMNKLL